MADPSRPVPAIQYSNPSPQAVGTEIPAHGDGYGGRWVSPFMPRYAELVRTGKVYALSSGVVANAKVPIVDLGTTTAGWALFNNNLTTTKYCLVLLKASVHLASGTSDIGATLWMGMSSTVQAAAATAATGTVGPKSLSGSSARTSLGLIGGAVTLAGAPAWVPVGGFANHAAAATPGSGATFDVDGLIIIPPQFACGFTVVSGLGTSAKYATSFVYAEVELDLV